MGSSLSRPGSGTTTTLNDATAVNSPEESHLFYTRVLSVHIVFVVIRLVFIFTEEPPTYRCSAWVVFDDQPTSPPPICARASLSFVQYYTDSRLTHTPPMRVADE